MPPLPPQPDRSTREQPVPGLNLTAGQSAPRRGAQPPQPPAPPPLPPAIQRVPGVDLAPGQAPPTVGGAPQPTAPPQPTAWVPPQPEGLDLAPGQAAPTHETLEQKTTRLNQQAQQMNGQFVQGDMTLLQLAHMHALAATGGDHAAAAQMANDKAYQNQILNQIVQGAMATNEWRAPGGAEITGYDSENRIITDASGGSWIFVGEPNPETGEMYQWKYFEIPEGSGDPSIIDVPEWLEHGVGLALPWPGTYISYFDKLGGGEPFAGGGEFTPDEDAYRATAEGHVFPGVYPTQDAADERVQLWVEGGGMGGGMGDLYDPGGPRQFAGPGGADTYSRRFGETAAGYGASVGSAQNRDIIPGQLGRMGTQADYLDALQRGEAGPSVAELQMQQGTEDAIRAQMAMGQSGPGWNPAAQGIAAGEGRRLQRQNIRDTGLLRAQEQQMARDQYGTMLDMYARAGLSEQEINDAMAQQYMSQQLGYDTLGLEPWKQQLGADVDYDTMMADQTARFEEAKMRAAEAQADRDLRREGAMWNMLGTGFSAVTAALSDETSKQDVRKAEVQVKELQGALADTQDQLLTAKGRYTARAPSPGAQFANERYGGIPDLGDAGIVDPWADRPEMRYGDFREDYFGYREPRRDRAMGAAGSARGAAQAGDRARGQARGAAAGQAARSLGAVQPKQFRYTDEARRRWGPGTAPTGQRYGMMAQNLAQTPAGAQAVTQMPGGGLGIDTGQLAILDAMATGDHERRLREIEQRRGRYG